MKKLKVVFYVVDMSSDKSEDDKQQVVVELSGKELRSERSEKFLAVGNVIARHLREKCDPQEDRLPN